MVPSVLQLLVDELQDLRRSVKSVKKDASRLSSRQICFGNMQHGTRLWRVRVRVRSMSTRVRVRVLRHSLIS
jgi:hypothetical protein